MQGALASLIVTVYRQPCTCNKLPCKYARSLESLCITSFLCVDKSIQLLTQSVHGGMTTDAAYTNLVAFAS